MGIMNLKEMELAFKNEIINIKSFWDFLINFLGGYQFVGVFLMEIIFY